MSEVYARPVFLILLGVAVTLYAVWSGYIFAYSPMKNPRNKLDVYIAPLTFPIIAVVLGSALMPYLLLESFVKWIKTLPKEIT